MPADLNNLSASTQLEKLLWTKRKGKSNRNPALLRIWRTQGLDPSDAKDESIDSQGTHEHDQPQANDHYTHGNE